MLSTVGLEPVARPGAGAQSGALRQGLGRAARWARAGALTDREALREACLNDQRYDRQCEEARGPWLWSIVEAVGAVDDFRESILAGVDGIVADVAAVQSCQFCVYYARRGDERFRQRLREIVEQTPLSECPWLGETQLIELEPEAGLLRIARRRGRELLSREWEWDDSRAIDEAIGKLGLEAVVALLDRESSDDVSRFREGWRTGLDARNARVPAPSQGAVPLAAVLRDAESGERHVYLRRWGIDASEDDLEVVLERLLAGRRSAVLLNHLSVFGRRPIPQFDQRLLALLCHEDAGVRSRACTALGQTRHAQIRRFALDHVDRLSEPDFLQLFVRNFRPGDEALFVRHLSLPEDDNERHGLLMDLKHVLRENPEADVRELALVSYAATPCGGCRHDAAELLVKRGGAPPWLIEECRDDSEPDTRGLVANSR